MDIIVLKRREMMNFYLFYGNDDNYINKRIDRLINDINIDINDIIKYNFTDYKLEDILEEASMNSMFNNNKLIIIDSNLKEDIDYELLERYINNYNPHTYMVIKIKTDKLDTKKKIYKLFSKYAKVEELNNDLDNLSNYVNNLLKDNNFYMSNSNINYFIAKVGNNINNIDNELEKLYLYKFDDKKIEKKDIDDLVINNIDDEIFAITNAVINNEVDKSLDLYNEFMMKNYEPTQIIGLLASQFQFLYQVKYLYNKNKTQNEIAKLIDVHPYRVKLAIGNLYNYTESDLLHYISKLGKLDEDIKTGNIDKNVGLELFLLNKDM